MDIKMLAMAAEPGTMFYVSFPDGTFVIVDKENLFNYTDRVLESVSAVQVDGQAFVKVNIWQ